MTEYNKVTGEFFSSDIEVFYRASNKDWWLIRGVDNDHPERLTEEPEGIDPYIPTPGGCWDDEDLAAAQEIEEGIES